LRSVLWPVAVSSRAIDLRDVGLGHLVPMMTSTPEAISA
jgi:hypothetical protein